MEYGYIITQYTWLYILMMQVFWCSVYRVFIIPMYTRNSLLEIIYIILSIFNFLIGRSGADIQFSGVFQQFLMFSKVT